MRSRRRLGFGLLCMMGLMVLCAGIAMAATKITCDGGPCYGTNGDDLIQGSAMSDFIHARGATDGVNSASPSCSDATAWPTRSRVSSEK